MPIDNLLRKIESLDIFSGEGDMISTPREIIEATTGLYGVQVEEMIEAESTEFLEGFVAALLFYKTMDLGARLNALTGEVTPEASQEILEAQIDTVITLLVEYLQKQRNQD
jgi:hypothetical protein